MNVQRIVGRSLGVALVLFSGVVLAQRSPVGYWKTIDDETKEARSIIEIYEQDGKLFGKILKVFVRPGEPPVPKCLNCEGALKDALVEGLVFLKDLKKDGDEWSGGTVLDPKNGKTYRCYIAYEGTDAKLKVRGYIGISLLGRTQYWHRTQPPAPPAAPAPPEPPAASDAGTP